MPHVSEPRSLGALIWGLSENDEQRQMPGLFTTAISKTPIAGDSAVGADRHSGDQVASHWGHGDAAAWGLTGVTMSRMALLRRKTAALSTLFRSSLGVPTGVPISCWYRVSSASSRHDHVFE